MDASLAIQVGGILVTAVTAFMAVKYGLQQVVKDVAELKSKTESKDEAHDTAIANHDKRLAVLESKFDTVILQMKTQLKDIYEKLMNK